MNGPTVASPAQCRAARALLRWSQQELARQAGVARNTVTQFEAGRRALQRRVRAEITSAFQAAGIEFTPEVGPECGEGVMLRDAVARGTAD